MNRRRHGGSPREVYLQKLWTDRRPLLREGEESSVLGPGIDAAGIFRVDGESIEIERPGACAERRPAQASVRALVNVVGMNRRVEEARGGGRETLDDTVVKNIVDHGPRGPTVDRLVNVPTEERHRVEGLRVLRIDREGPDGGKDALSRGPGGTGVLTAQQQR